MEFICLGMWPLKYYQTNGLNRIIIYQPNYCPLFLKLRLKEGGGDKVCFHCHMIVFSFTHYRYRARQLLEQALAAAVGIAATLRLTCGGKLTQRGGWYCLLRLAYLRLLSHFGLGFLPVFASRLNVTSPMSGSHGIPSLSWRSSKIGVKFLTTSHQINFTPLYQGQRQSLG